MAKVKLTKNELTQLRYLINLIEGAVIISLSSLLCDEETVVQFYEEKNKFARVFSALGTDIPRYLSQEQILSLSEMVKIGHRLIPVLHKKKMVGETYLGDFLTLAQLPG